MNLDAANIKVPFVWYNCSAGDDKKIIVSAANIRFEEACILFNVAASYIQLAGMESRSTSEGLKKACNYFMLAAGVFQHICDNLTSNFDVPTPADVSPVSLNFLLKWSLAAAQECFVLKGIIEKSIKDGMLAKLALATGYMYDSAKEMGEELGFGSIFGKMLSAYLLGRATYYKTLAQVKKAAEALNSNHYGEEISRLNEATNLLNRCKEFKKFMDPETLSLLDTLAGQIVKNLERAIKDNSIIYHETIPAVTALPDIGQAIVARATPMPDWSKDANIQSRPILSRLVPETIRIRSVEYYEKRNLQVDGIYSRLLGLRQAEQDIMRECNLPSILEISKTSMGVPQSIIEKSQKVRSNGGAESLFSALSTIDALRNDAKQLVRQVEDLLGEESALDIQACIDFGDKWTRPESETLTKKLHQALDAYKESMRGAYEGDKKVQDEFDTAIVGISSLDSSQSELEESIPACTSQNSQRGDAKLADLLRSKLDSIGAFESRRSDLSERIKQYCAGDHVEEAFTALGEEALSDDLVAESVISDRLGSSEIASFLSQVDAIECEQQIELGELSSLAVAFASSLSLSSTMEERQNALQTLESAYTSFTNLSSHLQEGLNFYSGLLDLLQKLRENTRDFTVSRGIEMEEMKASLERERSAAALAAMNMAASSAGGGGYMAGGYNQSPAPPHQAYPYQQHHPQPQQHQQSQPSFQGYQGQAQYFPQQQAQQQAQYQGYQDFPQQHQQQPASYHAQQAPQYIPLPNYGNQPAGQTYTMPPLRNNNPASSPMGSGSAFMMPQTQNTWQPGMPVQYSNNAAGPMNQMPPQGSQGSQGQGQGPNVNNSQNPNAPQYPGSTSKKFNGSNSYNPYS